MHTHTANDTYFSISGRRRWTLEMSSTPDIQSHYVWRLFFLSYLAFALAGARARRFQLHFHFVITLVSSFQIQIFPDIFMHSSYTIRYTVAFVYRVLIYILYFCVYTVWAGNPIPAYAVGSAFRSFWFSSPSSCDFLHFLLFKWILFTIVVHREVNRMQSHPQCVLCPDASPDGTSSFRCPCVIVLRSRPETVAKPLSVGVAWYRG